MTALPLRAEQDSHGRVHEIAELCAELDSLHGDIERVGDANRSFIRAVPPHYQESASNLIHYLALRRHDLRILQPRLAALGLSSLGAPKPACWRRSLRSEPHCRRCRSTRMVKSRRLQTRRANRNCSTRTRKRCSAAPGQSRRAHHGDDAERSRRRLHARARARCEQGMDCMRINCAHDDVATSGRG